MNISPKIKIVLKKIGPWVLAVAVIIFLSILPALYYRHVSGNKDGRSAVCAIERQQYSTGGDIDPLLNYQRTSLQEIFFDSTHKNLEKVIVSGNLRYIKKENTFYLRDGVFLIPLNISGCQQLAQFKKDGENFVTVAGIVSLNDGELLLSVTGLRDTIPGWMQIIITFVFIIIGPLIWYLIFWALFRGLSWILIKLGIKKKPEPVATSVQKTSEKKAGWSLVLAVIALPLWFLNPYVGILLQLFGIYLAYLARTSEKKKIAFIGGTISGVGLVLMLFIFIGLGKFGIAPKVNFFNFSLDLTPEPTGTEILDIDPYINSRWHFSIHSPKNWIPDDKTPDTGFALVFRGPKEDSIDGKSFSPEIKISLIPAQSLNVSKVEDVLAPLEKSLKKQYKDVVIINDNEQTLLSGHISSVYIEASYTNDAHVFTHSLIIITLRSNLMYAIGADIPADKWNKYEKVIRDSLGTFDFPQTAATSIQHLITLHTTMGDISFATYDNDAPQTVKNFIKLAQKGFYDNTIFDQVVKGKVIAGGDPTGTGNGGPGYAINPEIYTDPSYDWGFVGGTVMTIPDGKMMNGSQFMMVLDDAPTLAHNYTIFGQVVDGMDVMNAISSLPADKNGRPFNPPSIENVSVKELK